MEDFDPCTMCGEKAPQGCCGCYEFDYYMNRDLDRSGA
jgi:hypothetical protein